MLRCLVVLAIVAVCRGDGGEWKEVTTSQGVVRGRKDPAGVYTFYNIPYAMAPMGPHRYKEPLPPPIWLTPRDAVDKKVACFQAVNPFVKDVVMKEDCLIANVFVPITEEKNLPVMVYVHGGAFELGLGNMMSPKNLVREQKVIVVTFNYRLGVQGFLCLGSKDAPGNAGMKDQVALLKWVQKNIASFGGNPDNVTILGGSAGSISVSLLMLSKSAKGLFTKVVPESGVSVSAVSMQVDPLENAKRYARMLNFNDVDDFHALEAFYKNTPLESLVISTFFDITNVSLIFSPCVERQDENAFLTDSPINIIKSGKYEKVPLLIGVSDMEGLLHIGIFEKWKKAMNEKFSNFLPGDLQFKSEKEREEVAQKVKEFYFNSKPVSEENILAYVDYISDVYFTYPTLRTVNLHLASGHHQIYLYEYSFVDEDTPVVPYTNVRGATHCAQSMAVFDGDTFKTTDESNFTPENKQMKATMREIWYNFAVHGKPVPKGSSLPAWPMTNVGGSPYMSLGKKLELRNSYLKTRASLWEDLYQKYYREPVAPPQPPIRHTEL